MRVKLILLALLLAAVASYGYVVVSGGWHQRCGLAECKNGLQGDKTCLSSPSSTRTFMKNKNYYYCILSNIKTTRK